MKALQIEATSEGLRLARALVGSKISYITTEVQELVGVTDNGFIKRWKWKLHANWEYSDFPTNEILLPIDSLKLCPFVAMREGVSVKTHKFKGVVIAFRLSDWSGEWYIDTKSNTGEVKEWYAKDAQLDIDYATSLDGVEIVEV